MKRTNDFGCFHFCVSNLKYFKEDDFQKVVSPQPPKTRPLSEVSGWALKIMATVFNVLFF